MLLDHLKERGYHKDIAHCVVDDTVATFFLYTLTCEMVGFQQYNPSGSKKLNDRETAKYWTYHSPGTCRFWIPKNFFELVTKEKKVFVQEGIFDALPLVNMGYPAVAILTNNNKESVRNLHLSGYKTLCLCDGDPAGQTLGRQVHSSFNLENDVDVGKLWLYDRDKLKHFADKLWNGE